MSTSHRRLRHRFMPLHACMHLCADNVLLDGKKRAFEALQEMLLYIEEVYWRTSEVL